MNNSLLSDSFLSWHAWVQIIAFMLFGGLVVFVLLQLSASRVAGLLGRRLPKPSLREGLTLGLVLVGTIPAAALGLLLAERSAHMRIDRLVDRINENTGTLANSVDRFIDKHMAGVQSAASMVSAEGDYSRANLNRALMIHHGIYGDFRTMLIADVNGDLIAATWVNPDDVLEPFDDGNVYNVADRSYFSQPMATGQAYISEAFRGRGIGADPIVGISAPLFDDSGNTIGVLEGSLNVRGFESIDRERPDIDGADMIVVDSDRRVIYASPGAGFAVLETIASDPLIVGSGLARDSSAYNFSSGRHDEASRFFGAYATTNKGWRVYLRVPADQISEQMLGDYRVGGALLAITLALSLLMAFSLVRRVSRSVDDMNEAIDSLTVDGSGKRVRVPPNTPREFRPIFRHMRKRSDELKQAYRRLSHSIDAGEQLRKDLTQAVALKDIEIAERTADLEAANEKLTDMTRTDSLTGIANRREFDSFAQRMWRLGMRDETPVSVILMDIDYFKIYNDALGHLAGDACLREVAQTLAAAAGRPLDLVARYGGEEFVAVLGDTTFEEALVVAERMRSSVHALELPHPGSSHEFVTISAGIASAVPNARTDADATVKAADEALYYAKAAGRNCIVFRRDSDYVTYEANDIDLTETNVIRILAGKRQR